MVDTLHPPYSVMATWPHPNYIDPHTRGPALANLCIALSVVGIFVVAARLYVRLFITRAPGLDDALIVVSLAFGIALSVLVIIGNKVWWSGHHIWDIPISKFAGHRFNIWNAEWCYVISTSATKISVLLFYRRISIKFSKAFMIATWAGIIFNILYMIAFCLVLLLLCSPMSAYWNSFNIVWLMTHPEFRCGKENIELPLSGVFSVIGDFYSALLPILIIFNLNLSQRQKFSLYALFSLAFLIVAAGVARTVLMWQMMNEDYDFTWVLWEMWIWGVVELYVAIIAASAPALKPFLRKFLVNPIAAASTSRRRLTLKMSKKKVDEPKAVHESKASFYRSHHSSARSRLSLRESALMDDLEDLGIAYGGKDALTSWNDHIGNEIDNDELETKRYEIQHSKDGKFAIAQVWSIRPQSSRSASDSVRSQETGNTLPIYRPVSAPAPASTPSLSYTREAELVRNFSLPYSSHTAPSTPTRPRMIEKRLSWQPPKAPPSAFGRHQLQYPLPALPMSAIHPRRPKRSSGSQDSYHV